MPVSLTKRKDMDARPALPGCLSANNSVLHGTCQRNFVQPGKLFPVIR